ncbi:MAG TPA: alanyl-tRNA editing protein [Conexibacter sp.]|nr:alanyl-tRNA editing protein [Conexibacter sp.]
MAAGGGPPDDDAPLYQVDAYCRRFPATITAVEGEAVQLDRSAFYPGGGGQPHDRGSVTDGARTWSLTGARSVAGEVWYHLDGEQPPPAGTEVECEVDWERRYALMRTHTALHVLCAVVWRDYGAKVTGANMEPLRGRMDFEFESLSAELVREIEARVNEEVAAARPTRVDFLPREQADQDPDLIRNKVSLLPPAIRVVRVVGIEGLDLQADGGTHVADTSEVGTIAIPSYKSKGRINKRLELTLSAEA